jgi:hypothetical protein
MPPGDTEATLPGGTGPAPPDGPDADVAARPPSFVRTWGPRVGSVVSVALVAFVVWRAAESVHHVDFDLVALTASLPVAIVSWLAQATGWFVLSGRSGWSDQVTTWAQSQSLRYIPGGVWAPLARSTSVQGGKFAKLATVVTEASMLLAAAVAVGGAEMAIGRSAWFALCIPAPVALGVVLSRVRKAGHPVGARQLVRSGLAYTVSWIAYSGATVLAQESVGGVSNAWQVAGAGCFAWAAGFVVVFAPSGAGVREVAYTALVGRSVPSSLAVAGTLVARLVLTVAELMVLVVFVGRRRRRPGGRRRSATGTVPTP